MKKFSSRENITLVSLAADALATADANGNSVNVSDISRLMAQDDIWKQHMACSPFSFGILLCVHFHTWSFEYLPTCDNTHTVIHTNTHTHTYQQGTQCDGELTFTCFV